MADRPWLQTFTGKQFFLDEIDPDLIDIEDIAHSLSHTARYNGHAPKFLSVAEHSLLGLEHITTEFKLPFLLHDAHEAYIGDIIRPVGLCLDGVRSLKDKLDRAIEARFDLQPGILHHAAIQHVDARMLATESMIMFPVKPAPWHLAQPYVGMATYNWAPHTVKSKFLRVYDILVRERNERSDSV